MDDSQLTKKRFQKQILSLEPKIEHISMLEEGQVRVLPLLRKKKISNISQYVGGTQRNLHSTFSSNQINWLFSAFSIYFGGRYSKPGV